jgi:hypothetical protein
MQSTKKPVKKLTTVTSVVCDSPSHVECGRRTTSEFMPQFSFCAKASGQCAYQRHIIVEISVVSIKHPT